MGARGPSSFLDCCRPTHAEWLCKQGDYDWLVGFSGHLCTSCCLPHKRRALSKQSSFAALPHTPACMSFGQRPASTAARLAPTAPPRRSANSSSSLKFSGVFSARPPAGRKPTINVQHIQPESLCRRCFSLPRAQQTACCRLCCRGVRELSKEVILWVAAVMTDCVHAACLQPPAWQHSAQAALSAADSPPPTAC